MADRAKHAFGALERIDDALSSGSINAFDILFVKDANGKPYVGWIDKDGNKVICKSDDVDLSGIEAEIETIESVLATKANAKDIDAKIAAAMDEHLTKKYEITDVPVGTLVDYSEKEIRIMCPAGATWNKQAVGTNGDPNCYYATFKTYAPSENVVGYIEHLGNQVDNEILTDFSVDEHGRKYQSTWLAVARYDDNANIWTYYGANSSEKKYIGWDYQIDWYDANDVMIASDCIRINLSNEDCHSRINPYYVESMVGEANAYTDAQIEAKMADMSVAYEIIEF